MPEILPCPCCGGPGQMKGAGGKIRQGWVGCPCCGLYIQWKVSPAGAVKKWNQRTVRPLPQELSPDALDLVYHLPHAVNLLAERLMKGLAKAILYGDAAAGEIPMGSLAREDGEE